jgi:hypothetical protein
MKLTEKDIDEMKAKESGELAEAIQAAIFSQEVQSTIDEYNNRVEDLLNKSGVYIHPITGNDFLLSCHANIGRIQNKQSLIDDVEKSIVGGIFSQLEALYDLRDAEPNNTWFETYEEDLKEYTSNLGALNE